MSAHGAGAPIGDQARDTTAYTGRHRAPDLVSPGYLRGYRLVIDTYAPPMAADEDAPFYAGGMSRRQERLADRADDPYQADHQETPDV